MSSILDDPCLVLNRGWSAVAFFPVRTAIVTVMRDMGSVLDTQDYLLLSFEEWIALDRKSDRTIKTPSSEIAAPEVIVLKKFKEKPPRRITFNRANLGKRDDFECAYCGADLTKQRLTIDHVTPRSRGGVTNWLNCVSACDECNGNKANMTPDEAGMPLRKNPTQPKWKPKLTPPNGKERAVWRPFLEKVN